MDKRNTIVNNKIIISECMKSINNLVYSDMEMNVKNQEIIENKLKELIFHVHRHMLLKIND